MRIIDVTLPMRKGMPAYEGEDAFHSRRVSRAVEGDPASHNVTRIEMPSHCGTHVDAPLHFVVGGAPVDAIPLDVLCGPALVVDAREAGQRLGREALATAMGPAIAREAAGGGGRPAADAGRRILIKTEHSARWDDGWDPGYPYLTEDGALFLRDEAAAILVGVDTLSIDGPDAKAFPVHHALLGAGVVAVEGLDLSEVEPGEYELWCLPLGIVGCDGAPARVVLVER